MKKYSLIFLVLILLFVSCDNASQGRKHGNNRPAQTEQVTTKKEKKESLQFKKGEEYSVKVVGVSDGDTCIGLTADNLQVKCRIYGIDAPEKNQAFGNRSKQTLSDLIFGQQVKIIIQGRHYERAIAWVYTYNGKDISAEMIRAGMAWHYKKYNDSEKYDELENEARQNRVGLWQDNAPIPPWNFRKTNKR